MPANQDAFGSPTIATREILEWPYQIPGGIQTELNLGQSPVGFAGVNNLIPFKGGLFPRPLATPTYSFNSRPINGIADFFDVTGTRQFLVMQSDQIYKYNFTLDTFTGLGGAITDTAGNIYTWAAFANLILFSQNVDKIWSWDGSAANVTQISANSPITKSLLELRGYLLAGNVDDGTRATQKIMWCASGDPTNWTTLDSGSTDLYNSFGPIQKLVKINQQGFALQYDGLTQIIPTGSGLKPFDFVPFAAKGKGCVYANTPSAFGDVGVCYVAEDNVYLFTGSESIPIGSRPLDGNRRRGAMSTILNNLRGLGDLVYGQVITDNYSFPYRTYWLVGNFGAFIYSFDDDCWFQQTAVEFGNSRPRTIGRFPRRVSGLNTDIIGIGDNSALSTQAAKLFPISLKDAGTLATVAATSDTPSLISNWDVLGQPNRNKNIEGVRLLFRDVGSFSMQISIENEKGIFTSIPNTVYTTQTIGNLYELVVRFKTSGLSFKTTITFNSVAPPATPATPWVQSLSLLYQLGSPYK